MSSSKFSINTLKGAYQRWKWYQGGWHKYGLKMHDVFHEYPHVKEAIRRMPLHEQDARLFRHMRALNCSLHHSILPESQWTKYEEDDFYLDPYLEEIAKEEKEQLEWAKK